jgi:hypothetical protein
VGTVERETLWGEAIHPKEAAISEPTENLIGFEDGRIVDEKVDVSWGAEVEIAEDGFCQRDSLQNAHGEITSMEPLNEATELYETAKRLMSAEDCKVAQFGECPLKSRGWPVQYIGLEGMGDERSEPMMPNKLQEERPVERAGNLLMDELAILRPLGPAGTQQKEI